MKDLSIERARFEEFVESLDHELHFYDIHEGDKFTVEFNLGKTLNFNKFVYQWMIKQVIPGAIVNINKDRRKYILTVHCYEWYGFDSNKLKKYLNTELNNEEEINNDIVSWLREKVIEYFRIEDMMGRRASKIRFSSTLNISVKELIELITEYTPEFKKRFQIR